MKHTTLAGLLLAVSGFTLATPPAADMTNGKRVVDTVCAACHGADGNTNIATYPRLSAHQKRRPQHRRSRYHAPAGAELER